MNARIQSDEPHADECSSPCFAISQACQQVGHQICMSEEVLAAVGRGLSHSCPV